MDLIVHWNKFVLVSRFGVRSCFVQCISQKFFSLFLILNDIAIACYADDKAFYKACGNVDAVVESLRISAEKLFKRLKHNQRKGNTNKCHLILNTGYSNQVQVGNSLIKDGLSEKTLRC